MPIDPNVVYIMLILGLWLSVTAAYIPGTGVAEALAIVGVAVSLFMLANMPTNWWAVMLIVIGVLSILIMPLIDRRFIMLTIVGLALQGFGSLVLFDGGSVALPLIVGTMAALFLYHHYALLPVLDYRHKGAPAMLEDQPLVGLTGRVRSAVDPVGTVYVRGETWSARSNRKLEPGTEVSIVDQEGLTLYVEAVKQKRRQEEG